LEYVKNIKNLERSKRNYGKRVEDFDIVINGILKAIPRWVRLSLIALGKGGDEEHFS
jgi:hypothetical protein